MADEKLKKAEIAIKKKVESEERAFHIVNKLVDGCFDGLYLSECGKRISQANYDDIVEERAITNLCGYPLCDQILPNVPKKKYHISTKANKVYDISERKKFCSNQCFKASNVFKQQIPESPVWAREDQKIKIAISPHKGVPGLVGDEVIGERPKNVLEREVEKLEELDRRFEKKDKDKEAKASLKEKDILSETGCVEGLNLTNDNASVAEEPTKSTTGVDNDTVVNIDNLHTGFQRFNLENTLPRQEETFKPSPSKSCEEQNTQTLSKLDQLQKLLNKRKNVLYGMVDLQDSTKREVVQDCQHKYSDSCDKIINKKPDDAEKFSKQHGKHVETKTTSVAAVKSPLCLICEVLKKWVSINTVKYLQFESASSESVEPVTKKFSDLQIQVDCLNISQKMDIRENQFGNFLRDYTDDSGAAGEDDRKDTKSVPDYQVLKDEAEQFQLKVTQFITGKKPKQNSKDKVDTIDDAVYIPTVDAHDQSQIRVRIVLERLDKFLPDLLIPMGLAVQDVSSHVRELVYTFRLERDTIIFKPAEWTLVSLLLLKMLAFRVREVQKAFQKDSTIRHLSVLLKGIKSTIEDLEGFTREILSDAVVTFNPS